MLGVLAGLFLFVIYIGNPFDLDPAEWTLWNAYLSPLAVIVVGWLIGLLFTKTVGMAAMAGMLGAVIAAVVAPFVGHAAYAPAFLLHAVAWWLVQITMSMRETEYQSWRMRRLIGS